MMTHESNGLRYIDESRRNAPMNNNVLRTNNGPEDKCANAIIS